MPGTGRASHAAISPQDRQLTAPTAAVFSSFSVNLIAGGGAGIVETTATYPLDLVRTRIQMVSGHQKLSVLQALSEVWRQEGFLRLYRGLMSPLVSEVPRRALKFSANDLFKSYLRGENGGTLSLTGATLCGALTGATETVFHTPFECVKVRLQAKEYSHLRNTWDCVKDMGTREGLLGFYRGFEAYLCRQMVWNGAFFGTLELMRRSKASTASQHQQQQSRPARMLQEFWNGLVAGSWATVLNTPLDVAKTRIQVSASGRPPWAVQAVMHIYRTEGFTACFRGLNARLCRATPGSGILVVAHDQISSLLSRGLSP